MRSLPLAAAATALALLAATFSDARADRFAGWRLIASTIFNYWSLQEVRYQQNLPPEIVLVSPAAGSLIRPGTPIDLDVRDANLRTVNRTPPGGFGRTSCSWTSRCPGSAAWKG